MSYAADFLKDCGAWGIVPDAGVADKLETYAALLVERNRQVNLTAVTEPGQIWKLHFTDSLALLRDGRNVFPDKARVIDVGTGAGFPGMVLKLFRPDWEMTLLDAQAKRVSFLNEVADELFRDNARGSLTVIHARAEELAHDEVHREMYDISIARAVSRLRVLAEYTLPFLKTGGTFVAYKSVETDEEIAEAENALKTLGGETPVADDFLLPHTDIARRLVTVKKARPTEPRYPRRAGMPEKKPL
ncbi:MAG: 16S rRNA (guanine(527)-N(7))-methyltransferase RsmG [Butyrivibrio sp.]|nr:16S rRNA (guanine(527)-N(7))-methyltransferase RsmG [Butyrivibrio sp.]